MSTIRILKLKCDGCGKTLEGSDPRRGVRALRRAAREAGWFTQQGVRGGHDLCPRCFPLAKLVQVKAG